MKNKTFYIKTLGCKVNQYESQVIREKFLGKGYLESDSIDEADVCVFNTCTVTSTSDSKSLRFIRNAVKRKNKCVVVTGCMAEDDKLDISGLSGAKVIVKNKDKYRIPEIIEEDRDHASGSAFSGISGLKGHSRVFVKIQDGCNNACSYCKVRIVRGRSVSRDFNDVLREITDLINNGLKEIVLTGICLGAYGRDLLKDVNLAVLIDRLCGIEGDWRLRLSSIEPKDVTDDIVEMFQKHKKFCRHLHVPFQSGDNDVLKRMNRPYKREDYLKMLYKVKKAVPDISISTDIMVGFPGETESCFRNTLDFIREVCPMRVHVFPFSKRNGTEAYFYKDDVTEFVKKEREARLSCLAEGLFKESVNKISGKTVEVLVEDKRSPDGYLSGYTGTYFKVFIDGPDGLKGRFVNCLPVLTNGILYGIVN
jgi:threonylcarbamoyladenosine tRNA methylthiotransferase MtaB